MPLCTRIRSNTTHLDTAKTLACLLAWALSSTALWASDTPALSSSCEQFKTVLVGRMDPSISGYSMETMPANAPVPTGGKVIGTCEGGAIKIVYYRFGAPVRPTIPTPAAAPAAPQTLAPPARTPTTEPTTTPTKASSTPAREPSPVQSQAPAQAEAEIPHPQEGPAALVQVADFMRGKWQWLLAFLALALSAAAWAWWMHHNAYDAAGLPRGPKL